MPYLIGLYASVEILSVNVGQTGRVNLSQDAEDDVI